MWRYKNVSMKHVKLSLYSLSDTVSCHHKTRKESSRELTRYCWQAALLFACKNGIDPQGQQWHPV